MAASAQTGSEWSGKAHRPQLAPDLLMRYALPAAIVLAGALIAASAAMTNRWAISNAAPHSGAYRLDRWTGQIMWCSSIGAQIPTPLDCTRRIGYRYQNKGAHAFGPRFDVRMKDPFIREKFTKEQSHARQHAKEYFERYPKDRYQTEVESWRELQSRNIEFTMKRLREPLK
jgi:hypothetical protein